MIKKEDFGWAIIKSMLKVFGSKNEFNWKESNLYDKSNEQFKKNKKNEKYKFLSKIDLFYI